MNKQKRSVVIGILLMGWIALITLVRSMLAPMVGAAAVLQLEASNLSFIESMTTISAASLATTAISLVFAVLIYLVWRSK